MAEIVAHFTNAGVPLTSPGTAPTIRIRRTSDGTLVVTDANMTELGDGNFLYSFAQTTNLEYAIRADGDPVAGGQVTVAERYVFGALGLRLYPEVGVAYADIPFLLVSSTDHVTPVTGAVGLAATRSIDGGAFNPGTGTITEIGNGIYQYDASDPDMGGGKITFRFTATDADDRFVTVITETGL